MLGPAWGKQGGAFRRGAPFSPLKLEQTMGKYAQMHKKTRLFCEKLQFFKIPLAKFLNICYNGKIN